MSDATPNTFSLVVFVPVSHGDDVRTALAEAGAGRLGLYYDSVSFTTRGTARFRALDGATPFIGIVGGGLEVVEEERIETTVTSETLDRVMQAVHRVHPYEMPGICLYPLLDVTTFGKSAWSRPQPLGSHSKRFFRGCDIIILIANYIWICLKN